MVTEFVMIVLAYGLSTLLMTTAIIKKQQLKQAYMVVKKNGRR